MDQQFRELVILAEYLSSVSRAYLAAHQFQGIQQPPLSPTSTRRAHGTGTHMCVRQNSLAHKIS